MSILFAGSELEAVGLSRSGLRVKSTAISSVEIRVYSNSKSQSLVYSESRIQESKSKSQSQRAKEKE